MLRFQQEIEIQKPIATVTGLFTNRGIMKQWQPGLMSSEQIENFPYPKYKLRFDFGRRKMDMTETILRKELPGQLEVTYEMKGVFNRMEHSFESIGTGRTKWVCVNEFRFSGVMKIISFFMKDGLKKQSTVIMNNFKRFAESR